MRPDDLSPVLRGTAICDEDGVILTRESRWPHGPPWAKGQQLRDLPLYFLECQLRAARMLNAEPSGDAWFEMVEREVAHREADVLEQFFGEMPRALDEDDFPPDAA